MTFDARLRPFRPLVAMFAVFLAFQAVSAAVLFVQKLGLSPTSVARFYLGDEAQFLAPKTLPGLLKVAVPHLLAIPLTFFITIHLVGCVGVVRLRPFAWATRLAFGFALVAVLAGFGVRYLSPALAAGKIVAFVGLEALLLWWLSLLLLAFKPGLPCLDAARRRKGLAPGEHPRDFVLLRRQGCG
jgi:hypothetical protein